jgi:prevent-host-death family protein
VATIGVCEARRQLPQLLEKVRQGETITLTKDGVPVARLVPIAANPRHDVKRSIEELLEFREAHPLNGEDLKQWINEGR